MIIEKPKKEDFNEINVITNEIHEQHVAYRPDIFKSVATPILQDYYNEMIDNNEIYISKEENIITGYIIVKIIEKNNNGFFSRKILLIDNLATKQGHQGKGIGTQLMNYAIELARKEKCTDIELTVSPENTNAIKFYEKFGMKVRNIKYTMNI